MSWANVLDFWSGLRELPGKGKPPKRFAFLLNSGLLNLGQDWSFCASDNCQGSLEFLLSLIKTHFVLLMDGSTYLKNWPIFFWNNPQWYKYKLLLLSLVLNVYSLMCLMKGSISKIGSPHLEKLNLNTFHFLWSWNLCCNVSQNIGLRHVWMYLCKDLIGKRRQNWL